MDNAKPNDEASLLMPMQNAAASNARFLATVLTYVPSSAMIYRRRRVHQEDETKHREPSWAKSIIKLLLVAKGNQDNLRDSFGISA